jgi:hypothetical protein
MGHGRVQRVHGDGSTDVLSVTLPSINTTEL